MDFSPTSTKKAVPAWYRFYFKHDGKRYKAILRFSQSNPSAKEQPEGDVETFEIFEQFFAKNKEPAALIINIVDGELVAFLTVDGITKQDVPLQGSYYHLLKDNEYPWFK